MSLRQPTGDLPPNLEWRSSDGSTRASIPVGIADRIAGYVTEAYKSLPRRGAESGGLLTGSVQLGPVSDIFITGFEPIRCDYRAGPSFVASEDVREGFLAAIVRHPASEVVGFYRSHTRKGAGVDVSDQEIVDKLFPGLSGIVLIVKPSGISTLTGAYYFFHGGRLEMRPVGPEFPFLVSVPGGIPPPESFIEEAPAKPMQGALEFTSAAVMPTAVMHAAHHEVDAEADAPPFQADAPASDADVEEKKRRKKLQWEVLAAGLMTVAALGLLWWQYRGVSGEDEVNAAQSSPVRVSSLGLAVSPGTGDGGWRISWDPHSLAAKDAVRGVLNVVEDGSRERIPLSTAQIRDGAATYKPIGDDITFRLDLVARDNSLSTETYRVLVKGRESAEQPKAMAKEKRPPKPEMSEAPKKKAEERTPEANVDERAYVDSEVVNRVAPEVPEGIRPRITDPLPIDVKVTIDRTGRVTNATAVQHADGLIDYLGKKAVAAAKQWTFSPAKRAGKAVESTRTIHFVFEQ